MTEQNSQESEIIGRFQRADMRRVAFGLAGDVALSLELASSFQDSWLGRVVLACTAALVLQGASPSARLKKETGHWYGGNLISAFIPQPGEAV